jgi:hypothetical protein
MGVTGAMTHPVTASSRFDSGARRWRLICAGKYWGRNSERLLLACGAHYSSGANAMQGIRSLSCLVLMAGVVGDAASVAAQSPWRPAAHLGAEVRRDGNPFLLTAAQRDRLAAPSFGDSLSRRFRDMESATDVIPVATADLALTGPGLGGRDVELGADAGYEANVDNGRRRHAELQFTVEQSLPRASRLRLRADWRPSYFWKNYLSDAMDGNGDGNITSDERVYQPGTSHEIDLTLDYRRRLLKARADRALELRGDLELGYFARAYDAPFSGRDRHGPGVGLSVNADVGQRWSAGLGYTLESLRSDVTREVMILDETAFGVDFNRVNGATDTDARAFELVDRSRLEHNVEASVAAHLSKTVTLGLIYGRRMRVFSSTQPYDVADRDRHDTRNELEAELAVRLPHGLRLSLSGSTAKQTTNRAGDPGSTGDISDYTRSVIAAGLTYRF